MKRAGLEPAPTDTRQYEQVETLHATSLQWHTLDADI